MVIGCDPIDDKFRIANNSGHKVFILESHDTLESSFGYMKYNFRQFQKGLTRRISGNFIEPNDTSYLGYMGGKWEMAMIDDYKNSIHVFIIDSAKFYHAVLNNEEDFRHTYKRYDLNLLQLMKINWLIVYPESSLLQVDNK
ncbi:MAG TPA: hypothetical protein DDX39_06200 [Bacteroidales bacterium]|nr:MAG: hypothetical protein A2W98_00625 [Bacteroidetes bacterium GWF2_33_38]OFY75956.1 MAG: hypothetical protein A2265_09740 [Bacteroidetes bacterium RIFOXYA12_FULL_33_9]OFY86265.1 MAG: hypothetical protein A2236_12910 [Bacteroidetes bacterium RIFOXYA2_FULL_33_7]HBF88217.1 hypothetical protein [Bacteroidales bacterium]